MRCRANASVECATQHSAPSVLSRPEGGKASSTGSAPKALITVRVIKVPHVGWVNATQMLQST